MSEQRRARRAPLLAKPPAVEENVSPRMDRRRRAGSGCCALALAALSLVPARARAESALDIPPECGSRAAFDSELRQRLGDGAPLGAVQVSITRVAAAYHLRVRVGGEVRELADPSCSELFRASVVVAVAMLMPNPEPAEAPLETAPPTQPHSSPSGRRPRFTLAAGAGASIGTLPPPVLALELESKVLWRHWGLGVGLRYLTPGEERDAQGRGVRLQALGGGLTGIFRPSPTWEARLGFAAQRLFGEGLGAGPAFQSYGGSAWAAGPTIGLGFVPFESGPFWIGLGAEGQLNLLRGRFEILNYSEIIDNSTEIYAVPWLAGSAFVRLGWAW